MGRKIIGGWYFAFAEEAGYIFSRWNIVGIFFSINMAKPWLIRYDRYQFSVQVAYA